MADLLPDQLRLMAGTHPDEVAFVDVSTGTELTFGDWERGSNQIGRHLVGLGVERGDRVAVLVPPGEPERFLLAYAAVHKAGAVAVPTSTRLVAPELVHVLGHSGAVVAISGAASTATLQAAWPDLPALRHVVTTAPPTGDERVLPWSTLLGGDDAEFQR